MLDYIADGQMTLFDVMYPTFKIDKPIRLIELFAGIGSQAMALRDLGTDFEHYRIAEWEVSAFKSYKAIHMENDYTDYSKEIKVDELPKILFDYGISTNGKDKMTLKDIQRKGEKWQRETYNNIKATNNLCSVCNFNGEDLGITETDKYCYIMTYSFPCQDLSVAGKMKGMAKGSGTRSGLLWEVERLLNEMQELPQVLLIENVPQVISDANIADFHKWQDFLESKGYTNYVEVLNAKDCGVAQNRERCFMVSLLGKWNYKFPQKIPLTKTMKDYLEDEVDEKYYINSDKAQKLIQGLIDDGTLKQHQLPKPGTGSYALSCREFRTTGFKEILPSLRARDYKDPSVVCTSEIIEVGKLNPSQDGVVCSTGGIAKTLTSGHNNQPKVLVETE